MSLSGTCCLLHIYTNESDTISEDYLYETIVGLAKENGLAGATLIKGIASFGGNSFHIQSTANRIINSITGNNRQYRQRRKDP